MQRKRARHSLLEPSLVYGQACCELATRSFLPLAEERIKVCSSGKAKEVLHLSFTYLGNEDRPAQDLLLHVVVDPTVTMSHFDDLGVYYFPQPLFPSPDLGFYLSSWKG